MFTLSKYNFEFNGGNRNKPDIFDPKPFSNIIGTGFTIKALLHRLSPFLVMALVIPVFAVFISFSGIQFFATFWLQIVFFILIESYLLFIDFILWNYFEGIRKLRIWLIEFLFISFAIGLLLENL